MVCSTYDLVDGGNLGLEDGDGISDGWLLVGHSGGSETSSHGVHDKLGLVNS